MFRGLANGCMNGNGLSLLFALTCLARRCATCVEIHHLIFSQYYFQLSLCRLDRKSDYHVQEQPAGLMTCQAFTTNRTCYKPALDQACATPRSIADLLPNRIPHRTFTLDTYVRPVLRCPRVTRPLGIVFPHKRASHAVQAKKPLSAPSFVTAATT
jgi:hypothetical protein